MRIEDLKNLQPFLTQCSKLLFAEPALTVVQASRTLWAYYILRHKDEKLMDKLSRILSDNSEMVTGIDVANALQCFAEHKYVNYVALEALIKISIRQMQDYDMHTLGTIMHSIAKLDIRNATLFSITKAHLLRYRGQLENPETTDQPSLDLALKQV